MPVNNDLLYDINAYKAIADQCGLSERTVRTAFKKEPITYQTACRIAKALKIPVASFRIKDDKRGLNKSKKRK